MEYARVAVCLPVHRTFHYRIPPRLRASAAPGARCVVPFGRRRAVGFVVGLDPRAEVSEVREVLEVLDPEPSLPSDLLALGLWLSSYYHHPPGEALSTLLPPAFRAGAEPVYRPAPGAEASEDPVAARLVAAGELRAARLRPAELAALGRLAEEGLAVRAWEVMPLPELRGETWFRRAPDAPDPREVAARSPRQAEALEALAEGPLPAGALRERGVSRAALRRLAERGWVEARDVAPDAADPEGLGFGGEAERPLLTPAQAEAVAAATRGLEGEAFAPLLLQGVTGSGKTEVYIRSVQEARRRGRGALVLVPEIALTPQMLGRFLQAFRGEVAVLHSGLGERERRLQWGRLRRGEAAIAIGTRSAVFAPVERLGLVVVDEEHEPSYKQEEGLRYHAKHAALVRARACGAVVLLGSATPDVETFWAAEEGRYAGVVLPSRVGGAPPPAVRVVDLRQEERRRRRRVLLSEPLRRAVAEALGRGEQSLLFLNRRGFSPAVVCPSCAAGVECTRCSIALTLHRSAGQEVLVCHYCGARRPLPARCPGCGGEGLFAAGVGTQRLCEAAAEAWPGARVLRLDRDEARRSGGVEVLGAFHRGEADILVGTQMVAKGHHFPRLTVVGVVDADLSLHFPDFRAGERTFQVLTQVVGRAGREARPGLAVLQTRDPHQPVIGAVARGDYPAFAGAELANRREAGFPPFRRLGLVRISAPRAEAAQGAADAVARAVRELGGPLGIEVLGPAPAPVERVRGRWRFHVLLRAPGAEPGPLQAVLRRLRDAPAMNPGGEIRVHVDVDPASLL